MQEEFLSPIEASRISGLAPQYVYLMLRVGRIEGAFKLSGNWRIPRKPFVRQFAARIAERKAEAPPSRSRRHAPSSAPVAIEA